MVARWQWFVGKFWKQKDENVQHPLFCFQFQFHRGYLLLIRNSVLSHHSPCIWTRNSVFMRRAASLSFSLLDPQRESISSMKMIDGLCSRARLKRFFTNLGNKWHIVKESQEAAYPTLTLLGGHYLLLTFSQPFGDEVRGGDGEEGWVVRLRGNSFSQIGLSCTWRSKK